MGRFVKFCSEDLALKIMVNQRKLLEFDLFSQHMDAVPLRPGARYYFSLTVQVKSNRVSQFTGTVPRATSLKLHVGC